MCSFSVLFFVGMIAHVAQKVDRSSYKLAFSFLFLRHICVIIEKNQKGAAQ